MTGTIRKLDILSNGNSFSFIFGVQCALGLSTSSDQVSCKQRSWPAHVQVLVTHKNRNRRLGKPNPQLLATKIAEQKRNCRPENVKEHAKARAMLALSMRRQPYPFELARLVTGEAAIVVHFSSPTDEFRQHASENASTHARATNAATRTWRKTARNQYNAI
jgi:hypothetical protein